MASESVPFSVSQELAAIRRSRPNQNKDHLHRLPPNAKLQRRPINHAPIASPHAGPTVPKVVYVSHRTPLISAVKRVKKLLDHIEKRAMQRVSLTAKDRRTSMKDLAEASEAMEKKGQKEVVLVKASGRAMEQALKVGEWFRNRENEMICQVEVKTGNVSVVDDIVEAEEDLAGKNFQNKDHKEVAHKLPEAIGEDTERLDSSSQFGDENSVEIMVEGPSTNNSTHAAHKSSRKRTKRPTYDEHDLPEARIRWVKTVEVAISLKG